MDTFVKLEDGLAILRLPKGVLKQVSVYRRGKRFYVPHGGGYIHIRSVVPTQHETTSGCHCTAHPDVQVLDFELRPGSYTYVKEAGQEMLTATTR